VFGECGHVAGGVGVPRAVTVADTGRDAVGSGDALAQGDYGTVVVGVCDAVAGLALGLGVRDSAPVGSQCWRRARTLAWRWPRADAGRRCRS
jgi:hypothetical protein